MGILIGGNDSGQVFLDPKYANRHGLVAGATGTGKTVTLQCLAEGFSELGVPVFLADIKGDISGMSQPGKPRPKVDERVQKIGIDNYSQYAYPVAFWDVFGKKGTPVRTTISEMGPQLLSRLLNRSRGPAVRASRAQADKKGYQFEMKFACERQEDLDIRQGPGVTLEGNLADLLFLNLSTGPLDIQHTAGVESVLADHQFHLPPKMLNDLGHQ